MSMEALTVAGAIDSHRNQFEGPRKRVLCVCTAGMLRSPTIAWVLANHPWGFNTRAAGLIDRYALIPVTPRLLTWAEEIVCVSEEYASHIRGFFRFGSPETPPIIHVFPIPDQYDSMTPELIGIVRRMAQAAWPVREMAI